MAEGTNKRNVGMTIDELKDSFHFGMHGCGYYKGTDHVNALEALRYWRKQGVKVMEIDIAKTHDGGFVALAHLMNKHYLKLVEIDIPDDADELTEDWFMGQKLCKQTTKGLTPMNLSLIVNIMKEDSELFVMFDLWRMWGRNDTSDFTKQLSKFASDEIKRRCVIEVYNKPMLEGVRSADTQLNAMYCVHGPKDPNFDEKVNPTMLKDWGINIISYPWISVECHPGEIEQYKEANFVIFSFYKDNRYNRKMKQVGINVNLVDIMYKPSNFICLRFSILLRLSKIVANRCRNVLNKGVL